MKTSKYPAQQGFSLIELMVGLTIGLFVLMGVLLIYTRWDGQSRTSLAKSDAQMGGTVASYLLDSDLRNAGLGFGTATPALGIGCMVNAFDTVGGAFQFPFAPVQIVEGGAGPDTINVLYGNSASRTTHATVNGSPSGFEKTLVNRGGIMAGDRVILRDTTTGTCTLIEVTLSLGNPVAQTIEHQVGNYLNFYSGVVGAARGNDGVAIAMTEGTAYTLGPNPQFNSWTAAEPPALPSLNVTRAFGANIAEQVAGDVIDLQAQYGVNQAGGILWVDADALPVGFSFDQVWAIRYGILLRGRQYEPPRGNAAPLTWVTPIAPVWATMDADPIAFAMRDVMGAEDTDQANATNWRAYRYSVYEGVVPLRNMLWGQSP